MGDFCREYGGVNNEVFATEKSIIERGLISAKSDSSQGRFGGAKDPKTGVSAVEELANLYLNHPIEFACRTGRSQNWALTKERATEVAEAAFVQANSRSQNPLPLLSNIPYKSIAGLPLKKIGDLAQHLLPEVPASVVRDATLISDQYLLPLNGERSAILLSAIPVGMFASKLTNKLVKALLPNSTLNAIDEYAVNAANKYLQRGEGSLSAREVLALNFSKAAGVDLKKLGFIDDTKNLFSTQTRFQNMIGPAAIPNPYPNMITSHPLDIYLLTKGTRLKPEQIVDSNKFLIKLNKDPLVFLGSNARSGASNDWDRIFYPKSLQAHEIGGKNFTFWVNVPGRGCFEIKAEDLLGMRGSNRAAAINVALSSEVDKSLSKTGLHVDEIEHVLFGGRR